MNQEEKKIQYSFLQDAEDDIYVSNIDYDSLTSLEKKDFSVGNISLENEVTDEEKKQQEKFSEESDGIIFYCRDCKHPVAVNRLKPTRNQKVKFECDECHGKKVFYGTKRGVEAYFHISKK